jgi:metallophosphoesterase (TIGR00282 family)
VSARLLAIGDVVGEPGVRALADRLPQLRQDLRVDLCVANVENATDGSGFVPEVVKRLAAAGVDAFTAGDHLYSKARIFRILDDDPRVLRPANLAPAAKGATVGLFEGPAGVRWAVVSLLGRVFMKAVDCPFRTADAILEKLDPAVRLIVVDFHAEATAEKVALGRYLDGRVSAVLGTHTHVATADAAVLPRGSAYITDLGMTGPHDSVIGRRTDRVLHFLTTQMPVPFSVAEGDVRINGALVAIDPASGRAESIERVEARVEASP